MTAPTRPQTPPRPLFVLGLDLGQAQDYTALTAVEVVPDASAHRSRVYHCRHVERMALGTPYTAVADRVRAVQRTEPLASAETAVVADTTGVGAPVFEMLRGAGVTGLRGVTIHGGGSVSREGSTYRVPKRDLVSCLQVLFQSGRLKLAEGVAEAAVLRHELVNMKAKVNLATGHDTYEAWREGDHDDLVLSLAMACWYAEHGRGGVPVAAVSAGPVRPRASARLNLPGHRDRRFGPLRAGAEL